MAAPATARRELTNAAINAAFSLYNSAKNSRNAITRGNMNNTTRKAKAKDALRKYSATIKAFLDIAESPSTPPETKALIKSELPAIFASAENMKAIAASNGTRNWANRANAAAREASARATHAGDAAAVGGAGAATFPTMGAPPVLFYEPAAAAAAGAAAPAPTHDLLAELANLSANLEPAAAAGGAGAAPAPTHEELLAAGGAGAAAPARRPEPAVRLQRRNRLNLALLNATRKLRNAENLLARAPSDGAERARKSAENVVSMIENNILAANTKKVMQEAQAVLNNVQRRTGIRPAAAPRKRRSTRRRNNRK